MKNKILPFLIFCVGLMFVGCVGKTGPMGPAGKSGLILVNSYSGTFTGLSPLIVSIPEILGKSDSTFVKVYYSSDGNTWYPIEDGDFAAFYYGINWTAGNVGLMGFTTANGFGATDYYWIDVFAY